MSNTKDAIFFAAIKVFSTNGYAGATVDEIAAVAGVAKGTLYYNFKNKDINSSIYEYIDLNLLDRFKFTYIDFYTKYTDIKNNTIYNNITLKKFDPKFSSDIENETYRNTNVNVQIDNFTDPIAKLQVSYNQSKSSEQYKFDYYFNIHYKKI